MKRFLDKITPAFILQWEHRMLLNSPLGWQFQVPRILWFWLCITLPGVVVPLMMKLNITSTNNDMETLGLYTSVLGILQLFLFGYILIQFNATKNFVKRRWWHGVVEQLVYILIMMLCVSQFVVYNLVLDMRRATFLSEDEIMSEIATFNKARHYFMATREDYLYFPDEKTFLRYMTKSGNDADSYYYSAVVPKMTKYFTGDPENLYYIDKKYTRLTQGPQLYYIRQNNYLGNKFQFSSDRLFSSYGQFVLGENYTPYTFQLHKKTKTERLKEIRDFKALIKKYSGYSYYNGNETLVFESDEEILSKYYSNLFQINYTNSAGEGGTINAYELESVYESIMRAKYVRWQFILEMTMIAFFIAFPFAVLLFIYKNTQLRPILIAVITVILVGIISGILSLLLGLKEDLMVHVPIIIFLISVLVTLTPYKTYHLWGTVMIVIGNVCFAAVPVYLFFYATEYLDMFKAYDYYENPVYYEQVRKWRELAGWISFWGGIALYILLGSIWYKRKYEKVWAMPLSK